MASEVSHVDQPFANHSSATGLIQGRQPTMTAEVFQSRWCYEEEVLYLQGRQPVATACSSSMAQCRSTSSLAARSARRGHHALGLTRRRLLSRMCVPSTHGKPLAGCLGAQRATMPPTSGPPDRQSIPTEPDASAPSAGNSCLYDLGCTTWG